MVESKGIEIKGLNIKLGETDATLSLEDARELYKVLLDLFEKEVIIEEKIVGVPYYPYYWYWSMGDPEYTWGDRYRVWCDSGSGNITISDNETAADPVRG